jgi:hypothetical protein
MAKKKKQDEKALRPGILIAGAIGLVVVLAFAAMNFLSGRGGEVEDTTVSAPSPAASAPSAPSSTPAPSDAPTTKEVGLFEGRDPFVPLVSRAQAAPAVQAAAVTTPAPTVAPAPASSEVVIQVLEVVEDSSGATVKVGEAIHRMAKPGDKLSSDVTVDKIEGSCVEMHKGDESFRLCVGESAAK